MQGTQTIQIHRKPTLDPNAGPAIEGSVVELQLFTTLKCNLKCTYCSEAVGDVVNSQAHVSYSPEVLDRFIATHIGEREVYVTFYGGEPVLNRDYMIDVMRRHPRFRFQLQTNGTLIDNLPADLLGRLDNILISVDGDEEVTDRFRGRGVYKQVLKNVARVRDRVQGAITARVTWSSAETDFEHLDALLQTFDYVYWQFMQAEGGYDAESVARKKEVIRQLIARFFTSSETLYPFIPIMGMVRNKVRPDIVRARHGDKSQCRVSSHIINVLPDGRIFPCPDLTYLPEMQQGDLHGNWLRASPLQPHPAMPCQDCVAFGFCRYNCMKNMYLAYVQNDVAYRKNVVEPICELIRFMGEEIDRYDPQAWYARASADVREEIEHCKIYDYVEIMP